MKLEKVMSRAVAVIPWSLRTKIKAFPGIAQLQRFIVSKTLDGKEFVHVVEAGPAEGIAFRVRLPEDKGIWTGTYESRLATSVALAIKLGGVAYDIGGWHGFFAGVMAAHGARHVFVFEPLPSNAERIRHLIDLNPNKKITLHEYALGDRDTEMDLLVMPESSMAKLERSAFQPEAACVRRIRVRARSIDSLIASRDAEPPDLMKIDVEGAELMVLEGARETIRRYRPEIYAEIHSSDLLVQCRSFLEREGYTVERLDADEHMPTGRDVHQIRARAS